MLCYLNICMVFLYTDCKVRWPSGALFNIKMTSYWYRTSYCGYKTILQPSYHHNGTSLWCRYQGLLWRKDTHPIVFLFFANSYNIWTIVLCWPFVKVYQNALEISHYLNPAFCIVPRGPLYQQRLTKNIIWFRALISNDPNKN